MQECRLQIISNDALKGFPFRVLSKDSDGKIQGLRAVVTRDPITEEEKITITYKTAQSERIIGMQSSSKKLVQFCTYYWKMSAKGDTLAEEYITTPLCEGGLYKTSRRNKKGHIVGGTYAYWLEEDGVLYRSNYPDIKGSRRQDKNGLPVLIEREPVCSWTKNGVPVLYPLPEVIRKGSGFVYQTNGTNNLLSEARRLGWLQD